MQILTFILDLLFKRLTLYSGILAAGIVLFIPAELSGETPGVMIQETGYELTFEFVSNYVDRGEDVFAAYAEQRNRSYGSSTGAWAFQPNLYIDTPLRGLYLNIWGSFAMEGRQDVDRDRLIQRNKGGEPIDGFLDIVRGDRPLGDLPDLIVADIAAQLADPGLDEIEAPWYKQERNGLRRVDEIEVSLGYGFQAAAGFLEFGTLVPTYPNARDDILERRPDHELYLLFAPNFFPDLEMIWHLDFHESNQYLTLEFAPEFEFGNFSLSPALLTGYKLQEDFSGFVHLDPSLSFGLGNFSLGFHASYRPNLNFFSQGRRTNFPVHLFGLSRRQDGRIEDPARTGDIYNAIVNDIIQEALSEALPAPFGDFYEYTPRQKLPRWLYRVSVSYTVSF